MYIGAAGPELPAQDAGDAAAYLVMDGALRAWQGSQRTAGRGSRRRRDRASGHARRHRRPGDVGPVADDSRPRAAALRRLARVRQHTVPADQPRWLRELNLDPRSRAAAGLGAEIVRQNQEQFVQWCWEQVEEVLDANRLLSRTRLSLEALRRVHARHFAPLPEDRLLQLTAPLHSRDPARRRSPITASIAGASLPDAAADPALRRLTSPQRPVLRTAMARGNPGGPPPVSPRVGLVARLAATGDGLDVDPTEFVPHGLLGIPAMASVAFDPNADAVDLTGIGMPVAVPTALVTQVKNDTATGHRRPASPHRRAGPTSSSGVLGERHLQEARDLREQVGSPWYSVYDLLSLVTPAKRITDPPTVQRLAVAVDHVADEEVIVGEPAAADFQSLGMRTVGQSLLAQTDPRAVGAAPAGHHGHRRRLGAAGRGRGRAVDAPGGVAWRPTSTASWSAPTLDVPLYPYLARLDPARFLPGVGDDPGRLDHGARRPTRASSRPCSSGSTTR